MKNKVIIIGGVSVDALATVIAFAHTNNKPVLVANVVEQEEINKAFQPESIPIINHRLDFNPEIQIKNWEPNKYFDRPKNNFKKKF